MAVKKSFKHPSVLLVNPWIHDFAAYDYWAKPLGLLILAAILRSHKINVSYIDCLNRNHPMSKNKSFLHLKKGPYLKTIISKPKVFEDIPRNFCRYGIPLDWLIQDLKKIQPPNVILVTSSMTYWYPGTIETIELLKNIFPNAPIILGGIYPTLCEKHAEKYSGADHIVTGPSEALIPSLMSKYLGKSYKPKFDYNDLDAYPLPAFDLQNKIDYVVMLTRKGCPYKCAYCASSFLQPKTMLRGHKSIVQEIIYWHKYHGISHFVFYDDALLCNPNIHAIPMFKKIANLKIRTKFYTPNAVHVRGISDKIATLMFKVGFHEVVLGLENTNFENRNYLDNKITHKEFENAIIKLLRAGFKNHQIKAYLLVGLPKQKISEIKKSISFVKKMRIQPILAHYSPIPHTSLWKNAIASSRYDLNSDPIFTNNSIFPCRKSPFPSETLLELKRLVKN